MKRFLALTVAALMLVFTMIPAFAADKNPSPTKPVSYNVIIHNNNGGTGTYTMEVDEDGQHATLIAHPKKGYEFIGWKIKGKYTLLSGDLTDKEILVLLGSDIHVYPQFKKKDSGSTTSTSINSSTVSPKTNDNNSVFFFVTFIVLLVAVMGALGVKIASGKK